MDRRLGNWRYVVAFAEGVGFSIAAWGVTGAFGVASWSLMVDWAVGLIGIAFAVSLLTGVNLGLPRSIRNLDRGSGSLVNRSGGLFLLVFSLTVMLVGPLVSALLP